MICSAPREFGEVFKFLFSVAYIIGWKFMALACSTLLTRKANIAFTIQ